MLFNSYIFILLFLPLTLCGYFLINRTKKYSLSKAWLLGMSLWFYGFFEKHYLVIMAASIIFNFMINRLMHRKKNARIRFGAMLFALFCNIGVLFYFKYYNFFLQNVNVLFKTDFTLHHLILPLGISFFTFQQLSYVIDSYKKTVPNYNFLDYALFVTFFPQLIAGPIVTHDEIVPQFADESKKSPNFENIAKGIIALSFGLAKKVLLADTFGIAVDWGYANPGALDSTNALIVMLAYTLQIYFDFSGYCDMATGIGLFFNIDLPMNFNSPYRALSAADFWKRWHMTLTRFFTRYIYIPLGGNRKGTFRTYLNTFIVFFVSGIWHGANWTFILWGVMHGAAVILSKIFRKPIEKLPSVFNRIVTFLFINITWIFFRAPSVSAAVGLIKNIFRFNFGPVNESIVSAFNLSEFEPIYLLFGSGCEAFLPYICMITLSAFAVFASMFMRNTNERIETFKPTPAMSAVCAVLLVWCVVSFAGVSTFLYFNF